MTDIADETLLPAERTPDGIVASYTATHVTVEPFNAETGESCGTFTLHRRVKPSVWRAQNELQSKAYETSSKAQALVAQLSAEQERVGDDTENMDLKLVDDLIEQASLLGLESNRHAELFAKSTWGDQWPALVEALDEAVDGENWIAVCGWLGRIRSEVSAHEGEENAVPLD